MTPTNARPPAELPAVAPVSSPAAPSGGSRSPAGRSRRPPLGSFSWTLATGGRLAWRDRLALVLQGLRARAAARRLAGGPKLRMLDIDGLLPPDTPVAREALAMCESASPPFLVNHCLRAYLWARLLGDGRRDHDDEALYVALMLHDLGLTETWRDRSPEERCFTTVGARVAGDLARRHGWDDRRCHLVADAIALHLNVVVDPAHGREAVLVRAGSGADVAGLGLQALHPAQVAQVCARHPRLDFNRQIVSALRADADRHPDCRCALLMNRLGFEQLIRSDRVFSE